MEEAHFKWDALLCQKLHPDFSWRPCLCTSEVGRYIVTLRGGDCTSMLSQSSCVSLYLWERGASNHCYHARHECVNLTYTWFAPTAQGLLEAALLRNSSHRHGQHVNPGCFVAQTSCPCFSLVGLLLFFNDCSAQGHLLRLYAGGYTPLLTALW